MLLVLIIAITIVAAEILHVLGVCNVSSTTEGQILRVLKSISRASNLELLQRIRVKYCPSNTEILPVVV